MYKRQYEDYPDCENIFDLEADIEVSDRDVTPYESVADFDREADFQSPPADTQNNAQSATNATATGQAATAQDADEQDGSESERPEVAYDVKSNYFQVRIDVEAEGIRLTQYTLFERDADGQTRVIYRSRDTL